MGLIMKGPPIPRVQFFPTIFPNDGDFQAFFMPGLGVIQLPTTATKKCQWIFQVPVKGGR